MKGRNIVIIVVGLLILVSGTRLVSNHLAKKEIKEATMVYLTEERDYQASDIADIYMVNVGSNERHYAAVVTFKDEPDVDYIYGFLDAAEQISQIDVVKKGHRDEFKHEEPS